MAATQALNQTITFSSFRKETSHVDQGDNHSLPGATASFACLSAQKACLKALAVTKLRRSATPVGPSPKRHLRSAVISNVVTTEPFARDMEELATAESLPHGTEIEEVAAGVWIFTQPLGLPAVGLNPKLRMTAIKLPDGDVWVHSPVSLNADVAARLAILGPVRHVVISNNSPEHGVFARGYAKAYPEARIYATVPLEKLSISVKWGLPRVDEVLTDKAPAAWAGVMDQVIFNARTTPNPPIEALFCHRPSGILLASDTMLYADERSVKFAYNRSNFKIAGMWEQVGGLFSIFARNEKRRAKVQKVYDALLSWPYDTLVFSHLSAPVPNGKALMRKFLNAADEPGKRK